MILQWEWEAYVIKSPCQFESCLWKSVTDILDGYLKINLLRFSFVLHFTFHLEKASLAFNGCPWREAYSTSYISFQMTY